MSSGNPMADAGRLEIYYYFVSPGTSINFPSYEGENGRNRRRSFFGNPEVPTAPCSPNLFDVCM